jgi:hypothetical protein
MSEQLPAIIDRTKIIGDARAPIVPALIAVAGERASLRFLEFFAANICNPHTRRAYSRAVSEFRFFLNLRAARLGEWAACGPSAIRRRRGRTWPA